jgi:hypothetical protein
MNINDIYNNLAKDFQIESLPEDEKEEVLVEVSKTIQKQFILDIYDRIGEKQFEALQASANMGEEFYGTTLKHLVPDFENVFLGAHAKILKAFHG